MKNIEMLFLVADTQDLFSVVGIFGFDVNSNLYLIDSKRVEYLILTNEEREKINLTRKHESLENNLPYTPVETVEDMLHKQYLIEDGVGITPTFALIDRQGHRTSEVQFFAERCLNVLMYQGAALQTSNWRVSDNNKRLILANAKCFQSILIYYLYSQKKRRENYLYFHPDINDDVLKEIVCVKPDNTKKFGDAPENWMPQGGATHDFFDVIKMAYVALDVAIQTFNYKRWRFGQASLIRKRWAKNIENDNEEKQKIQTIDKPKESWFNS